MERERFEAWLDEYGRAWETRDPEAVVPLFSDDALYEETPLAEPMRGKDAIREYWSNVPRAQANVKFEHEIVTLTGNTGIALWRASYDPIPEGGDRVAIEGVLFASFDEQGRCSRFREWWHSSKPPAF